MGKAKVEFPDQLFITRTDEDDAHWFSAHETVEDVPEDDAERVVIYERREAGSVTTVRTFNKKGA